MSDKPSDPRGIVESLDEIDRILAEDASSAPPAFPEAATDPWDGAE